MTESKTQAAIRWLNGDMPDFHADKKPTLANACSLFGLKNEQGISKAWKLQKVREAALEHDKAIRSGEGVMDSWQALYELLK